MYKSWVENGGGGGNSVIANAAPSWIIQILLPQRDLSFIRQKEKVCCNIMDESQGMEENACHLSMGSLLKYFLGYS